MTQKHLTKEDFEITNLNFLLHPNLDENGEYIVDSNFKPEEFRNSYVEGEVWDGITLIQNIYDFCLPIFYYLRSFFGLLLLFPIGLEVEFWRKFFRNSWLGQMRRNRLRPIFRKKLQKCYQVWLTGQIKAEIIEQNQEELKKERIEKYLDFIIWDSFDRK